MAERRSGRFTRLSLAIVLVLAIVIPVVVLANGVEPVDRDSGKAKGIRRSGAVLDAARLAGGVPGPLTAPAIPTGGFSPQVRMGYTTGDQWEPAIAADALGHVYVLYPQYLGVPGCADCPSPTMILLVSDDSGATWSEPRQIASPGTGQWDAQIFVDPVSGTTVFASWLQNGKSDTVVARSDDFGATWSVVVADHTNAGTDKPILAVRGDDIYVGYNHAQKIWVSSSHDGGQTFESVVVNRNGKLGWALAGGGTVTPDGSVHFSWAGYERNGGAKGPVNLFISSSDDGGQTWTTRPLVVSSSPPDCSASLCGWGYLGAQMTLTSDAAGVLYALWNAGDAPRGAERVYFARSDDDGVTWTEPDDISEAPAGVNHAFPAIVAGAAGDVRISWMDARAAGGTIWNTMYRSSADGGATWSAEADISTYVAGYDYITPDGFSFPFGDYYELAIDGDGTTHAIFGEGLNYDSPGSIWYARGR